MQLSRINEGLAQRFFLSLLVLPASRVIGRHSGFYISISFYHLHPLPFVYNDGWQVISRVCLRYKDRGVYARNERYADN